jgi:hypothetical protein
MTSDNVFSDWLTSLVTFFDKTLCSPTVEITSSIFSFMCSVLQIVVCPFVVFCLAIVLSVLFRLTESDDPFGIFKLFFRFSVECNYALIIFIL